MVEKHQRGTLSVDTISSDPVSVDRVCFDVSQDQNRLKPSGTPLAPCFVMQTIPTGRGCCCLEVPLLSASASEHVCSRTLFR